MTALTQKLAAIRTEYERSISDAYAGGPTGRERVWARLLPLIDDYADAKAATRNPDESSTSSGHGGSAPSTAEHEEFSPILISETAHEPATDEEPSETSKPTRAKPHTRKATAS